MTDTFTWRAQVDASGGGEFRTKRTPFGDGYEQEIADGLNTDRQKWTVTITNKDVDAALAFVRAHVGVSFFWTPPKGVQGYYKCRSYRPQDLGGNYFHLSLEFEQSFAP